MAVGTRAEQAGTTLEHLEGCPNDKARIERDERPVAGPAGEPGPTVTITRCLDCGTESVFKGTAKELEAAQKKPAKKPAGKKDEPAEDPTEGATDGTDGTEGS